MTRRNQRNKEIKPWKRCYNWLKISEKTVNRRSSKLIRTWKWKISTRLKCSRGPLILVRTLGRKALEPTRMFTVIRSCLARITKSRMLIISSGRLIRLLLLVVLIRMDKSRQMLRNVLYREMERFLSLRRILRKLNSRRHSREVRKKGGRIVVIIMILNSINSRHSLMNNQLQNLRKI